MLLKLMWQLLLVTAVPQWLVTHAREAQVSYVSFFDDVLKFFKKRMDDNDFRGICGF